MQLFKEKHFLEITPGFRKAARLVGKDMSNRQREEAAEILENIIYAEYRRRGFSKSTIKACRDCVPRYLADDLSGRVIDLIKREQFIENGLSPDKTTVTILDSSGNKIASRSQVNAVIKSLSEELFRIERESKSKQGNFRIKFLAGIEKLKPEYNFDMMTGELKFSIKSKSGNTSIGRLELYKYLDKIMAAGAGGIAGSLSGLGYGEKETSLEKPGISELSLKRMEVLSKLDAANYKALKEQAEAEYLVELYNKSEHWAD